MRENVHYTVLSIIYKNNIMNFIRKSSRIMPFYFWRPRSNEHMFFVKSIWRNFAWRISSEVDPKHSQLKTWKITIAQLDLTADWDYYVLGQFFIHVSRAFTKMSHYRSDVVNEALLENALKSFEKVNQVEIVSMKVENATGEGENFIGDLASVKFMAKLSVEENQEQFKVIWSKSEL